MGHFWGIIMGGIMENLKQEKIMRSKELTDICLSFSKVLKVYCEDDIEKNEISETILMLSKELIKRLEEVNTVLAEL